jgi:hypothetical protein
VQQGNKRHTLLPICPTSPDAYLDSSGRFEIGPCCFAAQIPHSSGAGGARPEFQNEPHARFTDEGPGLQSQDLLEALIVSACKKSAWLPK